MPRILLSLILILAPLCQVRGQFVLAPTLMSAAAAGVGINLGIDVRNTSGYVADPAGDTYSLGEAYPTTRGSLTFGFSSNQTGHSFNRSLSVDPRLAGFVVSQGVGSPTCGSLGSTLYFQVDLPNGAGTYAISVALGDASFSSVQNAILCDGSTLLATISQGSVAAGSFVDATNAVYTAANWITSQTPITKTFAGTNLKVVATNTSANTFYLAHVHLTQ